MAKFHSSHTVQQNTKSKIELHYKHTPSQQPFQLQTLITVRETAVLSKTGVSNLSFKATAFF